MATYPQEAIRKAMEGAMNQLGYAELTWHQVLAVGGVLSGSDIFVSLLTGGGNLCFIACYRRPLTYILHGSTCTKTQSIAIVVSPQVSLMVMWGTVTTSQRLMFVTVYSNWYIKIGRAHV